MKERAEVAEAKLSACAVEEVQAAGKLVAAPLNGNVKIILPIKSPTGKKRIWCAIPPQLAISFTQALGKVARAVQSAQLQSTG